MRRLPGGKPGASVVVEPLRVGEVQFPHGFFERPGGRFETLKILATPRARWWTVPCPAFLIRHPSLGPFLVDTGLHSSISRQARGQLRPDGVVVLAAPARARPRPALAAARARHRPARAQARGHDPPASRPLLGDGRVPAARRSSSPRRSGSRRRPSSRPIDARATGPSTTTTSSTTARSTTREGIESYSTFGRTFDLFGDGSVRLAFTPGHSAGHQCRDLPPRRPRPGDRRRRDLHARPAR